MIKRLQNKDTVIAQKIRSVFQVSYAVEAQLLNATDFPPLKRKLESFLKCNNQFFGYFKDEELAAVIEIEVNNTATHIQSLVVNPKFFRQGIAKELIEFVFNSFDSMLFTVETGAENGPAIQLYKKANFREVEQYNTAYGIRKVRFEREFPN